MGLRISFLQEYTPNCTQLSGVGLPKWVALGDFDYVEFDRVDSIEEFFPDPNSEIDHIYAPNLGIPAYRAYLNLLESSHAKSQNSQEIQECSFVALVEVSLSSVSLDRFKDFAEVVQAITRIEEFLGQFEVAGDKSFAYRSLGHQDFVLIFCMDYQSDLTEVFDVIQRIRQVRFSEVFTASTDLDHHLFSRVSSRIVVNTHSLQGIIEREKEGDSLGAVRVVTRQKVAPGHENEIYGLKADAQLSLEARSVRIDFSRISELILWLSERSHLKNQSFGSTHSEFVIPAAEVGSVLGSGKELQPVSQGKDVLDLLGVLKDSIEQFSRKYVGASISLELAMIIQTINQCLSRNEKLKTIRDLVPFVRRLSQLLRAEPWGDYLKDSVNREVISREMELLSTYLWKAIRNRIEPQSESRDPLLPQVSSAISAKILSAYTISAWLCWEILNGSTSKYENEDFCNAESFCVCVCTGTTGRILGRKIFAEKDPNSSLLLVDISGAVLYRPEVAFVHCIHEMAEFSMWISSEGNRLRKNLAQYVYKLSEDWVSKRVFEWFKSSGMQQSSLDERAVMRVLRAALFDVDGGESLESIASSQELDSRAAIEVDGWDPLKGLEIAYGKWMSLASDSSWDLVWQKVKGLEGGVDEFGYNLARKAINSALRDTNLQLQKSTDTKKGAEFSSLLREVSADFSMLIVIARLRQHFRQDEAKWVKSDVSYIYSNIFVSLFNWQPVGSLTLTSLRIFIARWAILHRVIYLKIAYSEWLEIFTDEFVTQAVIWRKQFDALKFPDSQNEAKKEVHAILRDLQSKYFVFDNFGPHDNRDLHKSLASIFRSMLALEIKSPSDWVALPKVDSIPGRLLNSFVTTWHEFSRDENAADELRQALIFDLWAKSQKFSVDSLFS